MVLQNFTPSSGSPSNIDPLLGGQYEANLSTASSSLRQAAPSGNNDVYYTYTYYYGNGDFYSGYGYADVITGYYTDQVLSPSYDETYNEGYNKSHHRAEVEDDTSRILRPVGFLRFHKALARHHLDILG